MNASPSAGLASRQEPPIRVGILCNTLQFAAWQAECLARIQELPFAEISLFIVNASPAPAPKSLVNRARRSLASGLLLWRIYERLVLKRKSQSTQTVELPEALRGVGQIDCVPLRQGKFRESFDEATLESIRHHKLDVLLRLGFGILTGDVLNVAKHGMWSFHHGDPQAFRGAPPGFWEIERGAPVTGVVVQRLTETLDGGVILRSGWFKTIASSYPASLDQIFFGAADFVACALRDLRRDPEQFARKGPLGNPGPVFRYPKNRAMLRFFIQTARAWVCNQYNSLFRHQQWTLGLADAQVTELFKKAAGNSIVLEPSKWLPETKGRFLADPFVVNDPGNENSAMLLAEEFDWKEHRGHIVRVELPFGEDKRTQRVISTGQHFSYPYLIEDEGDIYCIPECAENGNVTLFKWDRASNKWLEDAVLIANFRALDATFFKHEERWWMFCTSADDGANHRLLGWHADELRGEWHPHAANPLKVDIRSARPAGRPFLHDGFLIRPAQNCSREYGGAVAFNRVVKLSADEFEEEPAGGLVPNPQGRYPMGLHTINDFGNGTIIDGARAVFVPDEMRRAIWRKLSRGRR